MNNDKRQDIKLEVLTNHLVIDSDRTGVYY